MTPLWNPQKIPAGACMQGRLDNLRIWVWHAGSEWRLAQESNASLATDTGWSKGAPPEALPWMRFAGNQALDTLVAQPDLPELPVVMRPEVDLKLLPGSTSVFYVGVPIALRLALSDHELAPLPLTTIPVQPMSKTWSGAPDDPEGRLCLSLRSRARHSLAELNPGERGRAICLLTVTNQSAEQFTFERLTLLTDHLALYEGSDQRLWTTPVTVVFRGKIDEARIVYPARLPKEAGAAQPLMPPRLPAAESISSRLLGTWHRNR